VAEPSLGIAVHVFKEAMGSEVFSRALQDMLCLYSNKVLKLLAKEHCKQPQKSVKIKNQGKNVRESVKTHGGKVVKDFAEQGARTLLLKLGMDAREGEVNAVIYHLSRSKNWKPQDLRNG
jgi:hypothetical protein